MLCLHVVYSFKAKGLFGLLDMSNIYYSLALEGQSLGIELNANNTDMAVSSEVVLTESPIFTQRKTNFKNKKTYDSDHENILSISCIYITFRSPEQKFYEAKTWLFLRTQHIVRKAYTATAFFQEKMNEI